MSACSFKTLAAAVDAVAARSPSRLALMSPFQTTTNLIGNNNNTTTKKKKTMTYQELSQTSNALAQWLVRYGYEKHDLVVSDLPNTPENLLLQLACNRLGVGYGTAKNVEAMAKFPQVKGAVTATETGFLAETNLPLPYLSGEFLLQLIDNGLDNNEDDAATSRLATGVSSNPLDDDDDDDDEAQSDDLLLDHGDALTAHGFYNTTTPYTNQQALAHGQDARDELNMTADDICCVSITLCHPFGIGSAVTAAWLSGAAVCLPAVGGIAGCGVPSERAAATLQALESEQCTLLFADTHTLKALPEPSTTSSLSNLRGGVVKIGSGATFLPETRDYGGVALRTIGKLES